MTAAQFAILGLVEVTAGGQRLEQVRVDVKYASRHLRLAPGALGEQKLILIGTGPGV